MDYTTISNEELEHEVQQKNGDAICELGLRYLNGTHGITANPTKGYRLLHKAEKLEIQKAYQALGDMYRYGIFFAQKRNWQKSIISWQEWTGIVLRYCRIRNHR